MFDNFILQNTKTGNQVEFNFEEGETPTPSSDVSNSTVAFTEAQTRTNIATGEKLSVICGKIKKFFSDLKAVAFSGSYNDLTDKPSIPTVNNATLTIKQGGTTKGTFTANANTDVEIDLDAGGGGGSDIDTWDVNVTIPSGSYVLNSSTYAINYTDELSNPFMVVENYDAFWTQTYDMFFQTYLSRTLNGDIGGVGFEDIEIKTMLKNSSSAEKFQAVTFQTTVSGGHYYQMICVYMADKFNYYLLDPFGSEPYHTDADLTFDLKCLKYVRFTDNRNT